jgi:hypothetical protein
MRAIRVASAALLGIGALTATACAPAAARGDGGHARFDYNVEPNSVHPGGRINLPVRGCDDDATVYSGAFDNAVTIPRGRTSGTATVGRDARPGTTYDVMFQCGHHSGHRKLAIAEAAGRGDRDEDSGRDDARGQDGRGEEEHGEEEHSGNGRDGNGRDGEDRPSYEQHGVHAGVGGSIGGLDLKKTGLGAALVAGSLGAAWRLSRRRRPDGTS